MEDCVSCRRNLEPAFRTLKLLAPVYEPVSAAARAFACMLAVKDELQASRIVRKISLKTTHPIFVFFSHILILANPYLCCQGIPVKLSTGGAWCYFCA